MPASPQTPERLLRRLEWTVLRRLDGLLHGSYRTLFRGAGLDLADVREYQPHDDVRRIDWNVTARTGTPYVKLLVEEREMTVVFLIDASASAQFGTRKRTKSDLLAEVAAILAFSAIYNGDRVGLLVFTDEIELFIKPKKGRSHVLRVIHDILTFKPKNRGTNLSVGLHGLNDIFRRKATVFFFSDFLSEGYEKDLRVAHGKHDVIAIGLEDRVERDFPPLGLINLEDAETGEIIRVNSSRPAFRMKLKKSTEEYFRNRDRFFDSCGIDHIAIGTDQTYVDALVKFFRMRERRIQG